MIRIFNIALIALMLAAATWTYSVKHEAERRLADINRLEQRIELEKDTISLLEADWAYLSQPARLQLLAEKYQEELQLRQTEPGQIVHPLELPAVQEVPTNDSIADIIAGEIVDDVTTGSVGGN